MKFFFFVQSLQISAYKFVVVFVVQYLLYSTVFSLSSRTTKNKKQKKRKKVSFMEQVLDQGFQYLGSLEILFAYAQSDLQGVSFGLGTGCE